MWGDCPDAAIRSGSHLAGPSRSLRLIGPARLTGPRVDSIGDVVRAALLTDGHVNRIPLFLGGTAGIAVRRFLAFKLHQDDVLEALGKLHFDGPGPDIFNARVIDVLGGFYGLLDLLGRGACLP